MQKPPSVAAWIAVAGAIVSAGSLLTGTSAAYVVPQFLALMGFAVVAHIAPRLPFAVAVLVIATLAKNFALSQALKLLLWQAADTNLPAPVQTAWVVAAGTLGCIAAGLLYSFFGRQVRWTTALAADLPLPIIVRFSWILALVGPVCHAVAITNPTGSVAFVYLGDLGYAAAAGFAYENYLRTGGRKLLDWRSVALLAVYLLLALRTSSKTAVLTPFAFVGALYLLFGYRPRVRTLVAGAASLILLSAVIYPLVTISRGVHGDTIPLVNVVQRVIDDPGQWSTIQTVSDRTDQIWTNRLYYGHTLGLLNRFSPNQIGDLAAVAPYSQLSLGGYVSTALRGLLPQTFGFQREANIGQSALQSAVERQRVLGLNDSNYGLMGAFYLYGGLMAVAVGMFGCVGLLLALYTLAFGGGRTDIWVMPFMLGNLFSMADQSLPGFMIQSVHSGIIEWGFMVAVLIVLRADAYTHGKRSVGIRAA